MLRFISQFSWLLELTACFFVKTSVTFDTHGHNFTDGHIPGWDKKAILNIYNVLDFFNLRFIEKFPRKPPLVIANISRRKRHQTSLCILFFRKSPSWSPRASLSPLNREIKSSRIKIDIQKSSLPSFYIYIPFHVKTKQKPRLSIYLYIKGT